MRVLAVDIGTNSTLHLLADIADGELNVLQNGIIGNGLGEKIGADGLIGADLMEQNRQILSDLVQLAREHNCEAIGAVGTQALRTAVNKNQFISMSEDLSLPLEIINGSEEARLAWQGVFGDDGQRALLDIGGGSSELSLGFGSVPDWTHSVDVGAVTLGRNHFHNAPPTTDQIKAATEAIQSAFIPWQSVELDDSELTGIAGTIFMLAALELGIKEYRVGCVEGTILYKETVSKWSHKLLTCDLSRRRALCVISPARAGSIHTGSLILSELMDKFGWNRIKVSEKGLLHGLTYKLSRQ